MANLGLWNGDNPGTIPPFCEPLRVPGSDRTGDTALSRYVRLGLVWVAAIALLGATLPAFAQSQSSEAQSLHGVPPLGATFGPLDASPPPAGISPDQIIRAFAAQESLFKRARKNYTYRETVRFNTLNRKGKVDGEYLEVDDIIFASSGQKREKVVYSPENTLSRVALSPADFGDIEHRMPFTLTEGNIAQYRVTYVGRQAVRGVRAYVFEVAPKRIEKNHRYFSGRIWVDAEDNQIIVAQGKGVPDNTIPGQEDLSLPFTTYRRKIDGKYWFPAYTRAEGILHFQNCAKCEPENVHVRETVRYDHYQRFGSNVRILYGGVEIPGETALVPPADPARANRP